MKLLTLITFCFLLLSCSDPEVNWNNYSPKVKQKIDNLTAIKNCQGLQSQFDTAEMNSTAQRNRTGESNSLLMGYIDDKMREAGCYS